MGPSEIPPELLTVFDLQSALYDVEEKVVTRPAPTKELPKHYNEGLAYAFAVTDSEMNEQYDREIPEFFDEAKCWDNAISFDKNIMERPMIYKELISGRSKKPAKFTEFDFKDFS